MHLFSEGLFVEVDDDGQQVPVPNHCLPVIAIQQIRISAGKIDSSIEFLRRSCHLEIKGGIIIRSHIEGNELQLVLLVDFCMNTEVQMACDMLFGLA